MSMNSPLAPFEGSVPRASGLPAGELARSLASSMFERYHDELYRARSAHAATPRRRRTWSRRRCSG